MIRLKNINKKFNENPIYIDANYRFKDKSLTCFLGASGSGKTTLLNLIAGFDRDYTGEIDVAGIKLNSLSMDDLCKYRFNNVGFIFQQYNLLKGYTALENVLMGIHLKNTIGQKEKEKRAIEILIKLGLEPQINQNIDVLSGGQKQRVAIARALINEPKIILADEATGALDSDASKSIMKILKEISKERTVVIITHDEEIATYADEVVQLDNYNINIVSKLNEEEIALTDKNNVIEENNENIELKKSIVDNEKAKLNNDTALKLSFKNFKIHIFKFIIAALIIAFGSSAFIGALGSKNITNNVIDDFKEKNIFYNKGQIPVYDNGKIVNEDIKSIFDKVNSMENINNVYYQYNLENLKITYNESVFDMMIKVPTATSKEAMAYGNMPRGGANEIVLSSNVASRLIKNAEELVGKKIALEYKNKSGEMEKVELTVCGLTNSQYQDFIVSTDIEKYIYTKYNIDEKNPAAISFDINNFEEIISVDKELRDSEIALFTKAREVEAFEKSFVSLIKLYTTLSYLILIVAVLISGVILYKISIERYMEIGLLGALGYTMKNIRQIIFKESLYFAALSTLISLILIKGLDVVYLMQFGYSLDLNTMSHLILIGLNLILTIGISSVINTKLIKTEPAIALRK